MARLRAILIVLMAIIGMAAGTSASPASSHVGHVLTTSHSCDVGVQLDPPAGDVAEHAHETLCNFVLREGTVVIGRKAIWQPRLFEVGVATITPGPDRPPRF